MTPTNGTSASPLPDETRNKQNNNSERFSGSDQDQEETETSTVKQQQQDDNNCNCFLCNQCPLSFGTLTELETHLTQAHDDVDGMMVEEEGDLPLPKSRSRRKRSMESPPSNAGSDDSEPLSPTSSSLPNTPPSSTTPMNGSGKIYYCRFCQKGFESRSLLNIHYTHTHRDKPQYECDLCTKVFAVKRELATHRRTHSGESTHVCTQCNKEFGTRQLLKKHWMWHTGERSHVCPHCGKAFFQKGHLTQHLMIHAGGRPHVCHLCSKTFIFKFDLNRHMKIHQERGLECQSCGRAFLKEQELKAHEPDCDGVRVSDQSFDDLGVSVGARTANSPISMLKMSGSPAPIDDSALPITKEDVECETSTGRSRVSPLDASTPRTRSAVKRRKAVRSPANPDIQGGSSLKMPNLDLMSSVTNGITLPNTNTVTAVSNANGSSTTTGSSSLFPTAQQQAAGTYFCFLCMRPFTSQAAYTLHLTYVHFKGAMQQLNGNNNSGNSQQQAATNQQLANAITQLAQQQPNGTVDMLQALNQLQNSSTQSSTSVSTNSITQSMLSMLAANQANESGQNQQQAQTHDNSFSLSPTGPSDTSGSGSGHDDVASLGLGHSGSNPGVGCASCAGNQARVRDQQLALAMKDGEIAKLRDTIRRVQTIAGGLLESCTDFDKLWMLHSKKVFTQIQAVLANLNDLS